MSKYAKKYELFVIGLNLVSVLILAVMVFLIFFNNSLLFNLDKSVNFLINQYAGPSIVNMAYLISGVEGTVVVISACFVVTMTLVFGRQWRGGLILFLSAIFTYLSMTGLKELFGRLRPANALQILSDPSFPSSHAALSAAFFLALVFVFLPIIKSANKRRLFVIFSLAVIILIGFSRLILNVHWFSDVVAGWSLGAFMATALTFLFNLYPSMSRSESGQRGRKGPK